jgi:hypothetical protein
MNFKAFFIFLILFTNSIIAVKPKVAKESSCESIIITPVNLTPRDSSQKKTPPPIQEHPIASSSNLKHSQKQSQSEPILPRYQEENFGLNVTTLNHKEIMIIALLRRYQQEKSFALDLAEINNLNTETIKNALANHRERNKELNSILISFEEDLKLRFKNKPLKPHNQQERSGLSRRQRLKKIIAKIRRRTTQ